MRISSIVAVAVLLATTSGCGPARFAIQLHRPAYVGEKARLAIDGELHNSNSVTFQGQAGPSGHDDLWVHFEAIQDVTAVDDVGRVIDSRYSIVRFEAGEQAGVLKSLVAPGAVLLLHRVAEPAQPVITVNGQPIDEPTRKALGIVVNMTNANRATDDQVFGTRHRQPVGASWPIDSDLMSRELSGAGLTTQLTGQVDLARQTAVGQVHCLELTAALKGVITRFPQLPPDAVFRNGTIAIHFHALAPVALKLPMLATGTDISFDTVVDLKPAAAPPGTTGEMHLRYHEKKDETLTPIK